MSELQQLLAAAGRQILERAEQKPEWAELNDLARTLVAESVSEVARLSLLAFGGKTVERELAHARATVANWTFVGAATARALLRETLEEAALVAGSVLRRFVLGS